MGLRREFQEFAVKGNAVDMAVGIILGAAFGLIVQSLVADVLMPPVGLVVGQDDLADMHHVLRPGDPAGPYADPAAAKAAGAVTINYGQFLSHILSFLVVAFAMFLFVRQVNRFRRRQEDPSKPVVPTTKNCPHCTSTIPEKARKCPQCTADLV